MAPPPLKLIMLLLAVAVSIQSAFSQTDDTLTNLTIGKDVTEAVLQKIRDSEIFPDDHSFLLRLAYVESKFGTDNTTFRDNYFGGIWQVDESTLTVTRNNNLTELHKAIRQKFQIAWKNVQWESLVTPLYSGLAAALYFSQSTTTVPDTLSQQAAHWKRHYRRSGNVAKFIEDSNQLRNETVCRGKMDLVIALDGSVSITAENFAVATEFVAELIEWFTLDFTRNGMLVFSTKTEDIFPLENDLSIVQMATLVRNATYPDGLSRTDQGIFRAVEMHKNATPAEGGVPRVLIVLTDGDNKGDRLPEAVDGIIENNVIPIAVGIGKDINESELEFIALNDTTRVFKVPDSGVLHDFLFQLKVPTCNLPQKPAINASYDDSLVGNEIRAYEINITDTGLTINLTITTGRVTTFWSRTHRVPNVAVNDGNITANSIVFIPSSPEAELYQNDDENDIGLIYIAIKGEDTLNRYTFQSLDGNRVPPPTTRTTTTTTTTTKKPTTTTPEPDGATTVFVNFFLFNFVMLYSFFRMSF